jgi:DNA polymerase I-like protein with 3'-5' exonuclease and polymerase domains
LTFPSLANAKRISIDTETNDPAIALGQGCGALKGGYIAGVSIGTDTGFREYYPIAHAEGFNHDKRKVYAWLKEELARPQQDKVFANAIYDLEYLAVAGVQVKGRILDVQIAEPLLDENQWSYALDVIAEKWVGEGKTDEYLYQYLANRFGGHADRKSQAKNIWRAPGDVVRDYAIGDIDLPLRIIEKQLVELEKQDLLNLFYMESDLIPMMLAMKLRGVKVDLKKAEEVQHDLSKRVAKDQAILGPGINVNAAASLATVWDRNGLWYPRTAKTNRPSFTKESLAACGHPVARLVESVRRNTKLRDTFVKNAILEQHINGRIHSTFNQLKSDEKGTVSGRFSSSQPNLQQVPSKGEGTELIRQIFVPDSSDETWYSIDYSQIEYRIFAHYSEDADLVEAYKDPNTDFHDTVSHILNDTLERKVTKTVNFLSLYGGGYVKLAGSLRVNMNPAEVEAMYDKLGDIGDPVKFNWRVNYERKKNPEYKPDIYDIAAYRVLEVYAEKFPAAKKLAEDISKVAKNRGYIRTILNRRRRFESGKSTHAALNALCQGSAADIMKKSMLDIWQSGICDVLGAPIITVHDELNFSVPNSKIGVEAVTEAHRLMEQTVKLTVPITCDCEKGPDWGHVS